MLRALSVEISCGSGACEQPGSGWSPPLIGLVAWNFNGLSSRAHSGVLFSFGEKMIDRAWSYRQTVGWAGGRSGNRGKDARCYGGHKVPCRGTEASVRKRVTRSTAQGLRGNAPCA
jgi:hypothetical protein